MRCSHCGTENDDQSATCLGCGRTLRGADQETPPPSTPTGEPSIWDKGTPVGQGGDTWGSTPPGDALPPPPPAPPPGGAGGWQQPPPPPPPGYGYQQPYQQPPYQQPGYGYGVPVGPVPDYLVQSIVLTVLSVCSCLGLITGILAIVFSAQARTKAASGDYPGAMESAKNARITCWITFGLLMIGILFNIVWFLGALGRG